MRKWFAVMILLALLLAPAAARAQGGVTFDLVVVKLWPEFDQPDMLVMYELTLSSGMTLPMDLDFRIPAGATIQAVAFGQTHGTVSDQGIVYTTRADGDWMVITVKDVSGPAVRIEYYDRLEIEGAGRHYVYQWPGEYAAALTVIFQQPVDATNLTLAPEPVDHWTDSIGLVYYQSDFGTLEAGESATLVADYQKATSRLSKSLLQPQPEAPLEGNAEGRVSFSNYLPWLVGGAGVLLIAVSLAFGLSYWRGTGTGSAQRRRHAAARPAKKEETPVAINCPECGHRLQPGDQFCRACGIRLDGTL
ncbi:MAG: hypothetical protein FD146_1370 [Anaerolineaceae bacterium]|nr:MAG: hypothetical protein FD146_1370 [Anaerolineaceae bacterium]